MLGLSFLSPLFLLGAAAVAVPVIIHLMQRKQAKPLSFSSLRFLKEIHARLSMRQRIREMILLMLRIALILLVALAMARPVLRGAGFSGKEDAPVTMIFLLDNSLSMDAQVGGVTNFERAKSLISKQAAEMKNTDRLAVVPLVGDFSSVGRVVNAPLPPGPVLESAINELKPGYSIGDPAGALKRAVELTRSAETPNREIYLLSDFQRTTWENLKDSPLSTLRDSDADGLNVYAVSFTPSSIRNATLQQVTLSSAGAGDGSLSIEGDAFNASRADFVARVSVSVDGKKTGEQSFPMTSEGKQHFAFDIAPLGGGFHSIVASLDGDDLRADNNFNVAFFSSPMLKALIINGRPSDAPALDAAYYLRCALDPGWKRGENGVAGISTRQISVDEFTPSSLADVQVVFLLDPLTISPSLRKELTEFVRAGGGLVVVPGAQTNPAVYSSAWGAGSGESVLPGSINGLAVSEKQGYFVNFTSLSLAHPIWTGIPEKSLQLLCNESLTSIVHMESDPGAAEVERIAAFENGWAAILGCRYGMGRIVMVGFGLDRAWSALPLRPVFPPICHRLAHYAAGTLVGLRKSVLVGTPLSMYLRSAGGSRKFDVLYPGGELSLEPRLMSDGYYLEAPPSDQPGFIMF
ncbi:MAG: BatA domain-containing protein, partial [Candidatus Brocadiia bacterium]